MATTDQLIFDQNQRASEAVEEAKVALAAATEAIENVGDISANNIGFSEVGATTIKEADVDIPDYEPLSTVTTTLEASEVEDWINTIGGNPTYEEIINIANECAGVPEPAEISISNDFMTETMPVPERFETFNEAAPTLSYNINLPNAPAILQNVNGYDIPQMSEFTPPAKPQITLPVFDEDVSLTPIDSKELDTTSLDGIYKSFSPELRHSISQEVDAYVLKQNPRFFEQVDQLNEKVRAFSNGELGISKDQEDQYLERAKEKNFTEFRRTRDAAYVEASRKGFSMPPGAAYAASLMARQAYAENNSRSYNEIAVKQAELQQERIKFGVQLMNQMIESIRSNALQYLGQQISMTGLAIDYAKSTVSSMIEIFNAKVRQQASQIEIYKIKAQVFDTKLRGALANIELYKSEIDAMRSLVAIDEAKLNAYRAKIDILNTVANVYRTQIDAEATKASLAKIQLEVFEQKVKIYQVKMEAKKLEWDAYVSSIKGKEAEANMNLARVKNYESLVSAYATKLNAKIQEAKAQTDKNNSISQRYIAEMGLIKDIVGAKAQIASTQLENRRQELQTQQAHISAYQAQAQLELQKAVEMTKVYLANASQFNSKEIEAMRLKISQADSIAKNSLSAANLYASSASAALSSMISLVNKEDDA